MSRPRCAPGVSPEREMTANRGRPHDGTVDYGRSPASINSKLAKAGPAARFQSASTILHKLVHRKIDIREGSRTRKSHGSNLH